MVVGGLAPLSSSQGATLPGSDIGATAYFNKVNAAGGVNGRKIVFTGVSDDGDDPSTDLAAAKTLVHQRSVFAIVPAITDALGSAAFLQASHVPTVGELYDPLACQKSYLFGVNGCTSPPASERVYSPGPALVLRRGLFRTGGARTVAVSVDDTVAGRASVTSCAGPFSSQGFKVVTDDVHVAPSPPTASFAPYVARLLTSNAGKPPDVVWTCNSAGTTVGLDSALIGTGYHGVVYNPSTYDQRILAVPSLRTSLQGAYTYTLYAPLESSLPAVEQAKADIHAADPSAQLSFQILAGYYAAELFVDILRKAGRHLTAERFAAAGNDNLTFDARGGVCPVTFPLGHAEGMVGGGLVQLVGTSYRVVVPLACAPMSANVHY